MRHSSTPRRTNDGATSHRVIGSTFPHSRIPAASRRDVNVFLVLAGATSLLVYNPMLLMNVNSYDDDSDLDVISENRNLQRPRGAPSWHVHPSTVLSHVISNATIIPGMSYSNAMSFDNDTILYESVNYRNATDDFVPMMNGIQLFQESCVPMQEWQMAYYPNCNSLHSLDLTDLQQLLGVGSARIVWKFGENDDSVALKTTKIQVQARKSLYESWRIDALLSERLTSSPRVLNVYGHCGLSTLNQVGTIRPEWYKQHHQSASDKAALALELSRAFEDVHSIDGNDHATAVWRNGKPENVLFVDGKLRIADFDESILLWRQHNETLCKFHFTIPNPKRFQAIELCSPNNKLDEKVDIYSLGAMLYCILVGRRPYDQIRHFQFKRDGILPDFPPSLGNDTLTEALRTMVIQCMSHDPSTRPTARQVVRELEKALLDEI